ncbi:MAG: thiamine-phosphate pyrophosphorylase [Pseudomonadota bacterium]|nr:thiamine-phosphate pyrophosphorylase [Pseudomonadota bacterium]
MPQMHRLRGLYAITPEDPDEARLLGMAKSALTGGVRILQYRDKTGDASRRLRLAGALASLCRQHDACFIVNDDLELALRVGAGGVHLGGDDGNLVEARRALPVGVVLGASCYADFECARAAVAAGVDYVAFGAVHPSPTKPLAVRAPLELFGRCRDDLGIPSCAIGGISLTNASSLLAAGASMLAIITDLFSAPDIAGRAQAYQQLFEEPPDELPQPATL